MRIHTFDVLSSLLSRLKLESTVAGAFDTRGDYSIETGDYSGLKLYLILKGEFWLSIAGEKSPQHIREGDCVLLTNGRSARLSRWPDSTDTVSLLSLVPHAKDGVMTVNGGGEFFSVGIHFLFKGHLPRVLFLHLPSSILVPSSSDHAAALRWNIETFRSEYMSQNLGRSFHLEHLAPIILLLILRSHISSGVPRSNWLFALTDPNLSRAIEAMHKDFRQEWSLDSLAKVANLSRSGFALNFKKQVGLSPMDYLTQWRMHVACELLADAEMGVSETADAVGYKSESAFSTAFKKVMGCRPGIYGRQGL